MYSAPNHCSHCGFENPEGHLFCENCGQSLILSDIAPVYINTIKHQSHLITLNVMHRRYWYWGATAIAVVYIHWLLANPQYSALVLAIGMLLSYVIPNRFQSVVELPIPPEILSKNIIAYGPANKKGCFFFSSGLLYFLDDGFFYKSYSLKGNTYSQFIEKGNIRCIRGLDHLPFANFPHKIVIEGANGIIETFNLYQRSQWLILFYQFGIPVELGDMVFSPDQSK